MKRSLATFGFLFIMISPAIAASECAEIRDEEGEAAYELCRRRDHLEQLNDTVKEFERIIRNHREDISDYFEDVRDDLEAERDQTKRFYERQERDERRILEDMRDDEVDNVRIEEKRLDIEAISKEKSLVERYFNAQIEYTDRQKELYEIRSDLHFFEYELRLRGGQVPKFIRY